MSKSFRLNFLRGNCPARYYHRGVQLCDETEEGAREISDMVDRIPDQEEDIRDKKDRRSR